MTEILSRAHEAEMNAAADRAAEQDALADAIEALLADVRRSLQASHCEAGATAVRTGDEEVA